jgi:hypothetical protein
MFKNKEPKSYQIKGKQLVCPFCKCEKFWVRKAQLNSAVSTFFELDWTDKSATCFVCSECTHIQWFLGA